MSTKDEVETDNEEGVDFLAATLTEAEIHLLRARVIERAFRTLFEEDVRDFLIDNTCVGAKDVSRKAKALETAMDTTAALSKQVYDLRIKLGAVSCASSSGMCE